jgi:hypothetical protein
MLIDVGEAETSRTIPDNTLTPSAPASATSTVIAHNVLDEEIFVPAAAPDSALIWSTEKASSEAAEPAESSVAHTGTLAPSDGEIGVPDAREDEAPSSDDEAPDTEVQDSEVQVLMCSNNKRVACSSKYPPQSLPICSGHTWHDLVLLARKGRAFSMFAVLASCVVFCFSLYRDWTLQVGDAKLGAEAAQIHELKLALTHGQPGSPCVDRWEHKYPDEVEDWKGHSCLWKKQWGQCHDFTRQCARTCGACSNASTTSSHTTVPAKHPQGGGVTTVVS